MKALVVFRGIGQQKRYSHAALPVFGSSTTTVIDPSRFWTTSHATEADRHGHAKKIALSAGDFAFFYDRSQK